MSARKIAGGALVSLPFLILISVVVAEGGAIVALAFSFVVAVMAAAVFAGLKLLVD